MRSMLFVIASFALTIFCWGVYGPVLHWGQEEMSLAGGKAALRPYVCVGLAYFAIGVLVPSLLLYFRGEAGRWTARGIAMSLAGGALGAVGALGIILAFKFGGKPMYVMPLVFGGAPVVNAFLTIYLARRMKEIGPIFIAGLMMVILGAVTVLVSAPVKKLPPKDAPVAVEVAERTADPETVGAGERALTFLWQILSIVTVVACWGSYGPTLHIGQAGMENSRLRPLICVGLAYFVIAVVASYAILATNPEPSTFNFAGTLWSLCAGAAGAVGALGIIMAFNFGGKPVYVMPLVFGGAPVVNTLFTAVESGAFATTRPLQLAAFLAGLLLVIAGAVMVLVFAPRGGRPAKPSLAPKAPARKEAEAAAP